MEIVETWYYFKDGSILMEWLFNTCTLGNKQHYSVDSLFGWFYGLHVAATECGVNP